MSYRIASTEDCLKSTRMRVGQLEHSWLLIKQIPTSLSVSEEVVANIPRGTTLETTDVSGVTYWKIGTDYILKEDSLYHNKPFCAYNLNSSTLALSVAYNGVWRLSDYTQAPRLFARNTNTLLKDPSLSYPDDRLIREEDIITRTEPITVTFDDYYFSVEVVDPSDFIAEDSRTASESWDPYVYYTGLANNNIVTKSGDKYDFNVLKKWNLVSYLVKPGASIRVSANYKTDLIIPQAAVLASADDSELYTTTDNGDVDFDSFEYNVYDSCWIAILSGKFVMIQYMPTHHTDISGLIAEHTSDGRLLIILVPTTSLWAVINPWSDNTRAIVHTVRADLEEEPVRLDLFKEYVSRTHDSVTSFDDQFSWYSFPIIVEAGTTLNLSYSCYKDLVYGYYPILSSGYPSDQLTRGVGNTYATLTKVVLSNEWGSVIEEYEGNWTNADAGSTAVSTVVPRLPRTMVNSYVASGVSYTKIKLKIAASPIVSINDITINDTSVANYITDGDSTEDYVILEVSDDFPIYHLLKLAISFSSTSYVTVRGSTTLKNYGDDVTHVFSEYLTRDRYNGKEVETIVVTLTSYPFLFKNTNYSNVYLPNWLNWKNVIDPTTNSLLSIHRDCVTAYGNYHSTTLTPLGQGQSTYHYRKIDEMQPIFGHTPLLKTFTINLDGQGRTKDFNIKSNSFTNTGLTSYELRINPLSSDMRVVYEDSVFKSCLALSNVSLHHLTKLLGNDCFRYSGIESLNMSSFSYLNSIGDYCFYQTPNLKKIVLPESILTIGKYCFYGDTLFTKIESLDSVNAGDNVIFITDQNGNNNTTFIEEGTFALCTGLTSISLPWSVLLINTLAFLGCNNIQHFMSPGLEIVEEKAFGDTWIEGIESEGLELVEGVGSTLYKLPGTTGILFDITDADLGGLNSDHTVCTYISPKEDNSRLILYKCNEKQTWPSWLSNGGRHRYSIPRNTISISPYAFSGNYDFGTIGCLNNDVDYLLKYIGRNAFKDNNLILSFKFPKKGTVTYLGPGAFQGCTRLSEVYDFKQLPITKIEDYTFYNCGDNKYGIGASQDAGYCNLAFYIPDATTSIGNYAFAKCPLLMGIYNLANCNITSIGEGAFLGCFLNTAWKSAEAKRIALLVAGIVMAAVGTIATFGTTALALTGGEISLGIEWAATNAGFVGGAAGTTLGGLVITDNDDVANPLDVELWLPKVTNIGRAAFKDCSHLTTVVVSDELTTIAADTFNSCKNFRHLYGVPSTYNFGDTEDVYTSLQVTHIGLRAFKGCKLLSIFTMPHLLRLIEVIDDDAFFQANLSGGMVNRQMIIPNSIRKLGNRSLQLDNLYQNHTRDWLFIHQDPTQIDCGTDVFPSKHINIHIPAGSLNNYLQAFPNLNADKFTEIDLNDLFWHKLKEAGYSVPWIND